MLKIRKLQPNEYNKYRQVFIEEYQKDLIDNHKITPEIARSKAQATIDNSFPDGQLASHSILQCVELPKADKHEIIGYIWYNIVDDNSVFIMDFYIFEAYRGNGYGSQTMCLIEKQIKENALTQIGLRVAPQNEAALHIYQKAGFKITGFNMIKNI